VRVTILAPPGVQSLDVVGPAEIFWEAARRLGAPDAYQVQVMAVEQGPISGTGNLRFLPDRTIHDPDQPIDTLLVAGDPSFQAVLPAAVSWLQRRVPEVRRFGSICTGVFLLAAAGLLDDKTVTTHWEMAAELQRMYPHLKLDTDKIFIRDGALSTTAGVTAGMDLALAMVEEDHGRDLALIVARYMVMFLKRPGGQSQFSPYLAAQTSSQTRIQKVQEYILRHSAGDLSVEELASVAGMSERNFARMFRQETKLTPAGFVNAVRLDAARRMLVDTDGSLQRVAVQSGFAEVYTMRRAFLRHLGVAPADYRRRFRT